MSDGTVSALPDRSLRRDEVTALEGHDSFDACFPVYCRNGNEDETVVVLLKTDGHAHLLVYNPIEATWERASTFPEIESIEEILDLDFESFEEHIGAYYDEEELEPGTGPLESNLAYDIVSTFPDNALPEEAIEEIRSNPLVVEAFPMVRRRIDEGIVLLVLIVDDPLAQQHVVAGAGYDPSLELWDVVETLDGTADDRETALEQFELAIGLWGENHYHVDELLFEDEPGEWLSLD